MKTSKKILTVLAGAILLTVVVYMTALRGHLLTYLQGKNKDYQKVEIEQFDRLEISTGWHVTIRPGREFIVEVEGGSAGPLVETDNGKLYFKSIHDANEVVNVKVMVPALKGARVSKGSTLRMDNYDADSLDIVLDGGLFVGNNNKIGFTNLTANTAAQAKISDLEE